MKEAASMRYLALGEGSFHLLREGIHGVSITEREGERKRDS